MDALSGLNVFTLLYKTTTGDENKGLGSGADAYSFAYKFAKRVGGKYAIHALGSYTLNNDYTNQWNTNIDYGDSYLVVLGGSMPCLLFEKVTTSAKLMYFHADDTSFSGFESGKTDAVDLWIQRDSVHLVSGVPLGAGIKIPIMSEIDTGGGLTNDDTTFSFYVSVSGLF